MIDHTPWKDLRLIEAQFKKAPDHAANLGLKMVLMGGDTAA